MQSTPGKKKKNEKREECIVPASVKYLSILAVNILDCGGQRGRDWRILHECAIQGGRVRQEMFP